METDDTRSDEVEALPARSPLKQILIFLPALAFVALLAYGLLKSADSPVAEGSALPDFELQTLTGETLTRDDVLGRPLVINFWASWCIPCREEARLLEETYQEYEEDILFLGVNIKDAESDARDFVDEFNISYPIIRDPGETLARDLGVFGLPETFFIDHEGNFVGTATGAEQGSSSGPTQDSTVVLGAISRNQLIAGINELLEKLRVD
jgi:cytochrome c biogenesis protein CcmG, thiol:disulfide interchange protein DsbE